MSADPQAHRRVAHAPAPTRRHLAPNVIALWPEDHRQPVVNQLRRGGYPRGVQALRDRDRLRVGAYAYLWPPNPAGRNRGKVVRLLSRYPDGDWKIEAVSGEIERIDGTTSRLAAARPSMLRRCPAPVGVRHA